MEIWCFLCMVINFAVASALIFIISGMLPVQQILPSLDFNVLLMIAGMMGIISLFTDSKMPELLADLIMKKFPNIQWAAVDLALFAGIIFALAFHLRWLPLFRHTYLFRYFSVRKISSLFYIQIWNMICIHNTGYNIRKDPFNQLMHYL